MFYCIAKGELRDQVKTFSKSIHHCNEAAIALAYLMSLNKWTLKQAFLSLKRKRPSIDPKDNFLFSLVELEEKIFGESTTDKEQSVQKTESTNIEVTRTYYVPELVDLILDQHLDTIQEHIQKCLVGNNWKGKTTFF